MPISFRKLRVVLEAKGLKHKLRQNGIMPSTLDRMLKDKPVSSEIIGRVCNILNCQPEDIMEYVPNENINQ